MALVRLSSEHAARSLLQRLLNAGRATIEQFDHPPPGHLNPSCYRNLARAPEAPETVQISDPRDFTPIAGQTLALGPSGGLSEPCDDHRVPPPPDQPDPSTDHALHFDPDSLDF